ncbi:MAG: hypothetical protein ABIX10_02325 [Acidimicrobiales bacterium]
MLYEDDVTDAVCVELERRGWMIVQKLRATQKGDDIVAVRGTERLVVEAKGETSSKPTTGRYGSAFDSGQVNSHVSRAMLRAMRVVSEGCQAAVAFPNEELHRLEIETVRIAIGRLGVAVCWVSPDCSVEIDQTADFEV